jgi:acetyltransferase-like isoleucine patch superfamily enzyme
MGEAGNAIPGVQATQGRGAAGHGCLTGGLTGLYPFGVREKPVTISVYTKDILADVVAQSGFEIGDHTHGQPAIRGQGEAARLRIGRYCSIADGVTIYLGGNHRTDWVSTYPFNTMARWPDAAGITGHPATRGDVLIGNDVWLGDGCTIMSGVTIGDGAVVGARAMVTRDVAPYAIVAGNPARAVRTRFEPDIVERLLDVAWWTWPDEKVRRFVPLLMGGDIEAFLSAVEKGGLDVPANVATTGWFRGAFRRLLKRA